MPQKGGAGEPLVPFNLSNENKARCRDDKEKQATSRSECHRTSPMNHGARRRMQTIMERSMFETSGGTIPARSAPSRTNKETVEKPVYPWDHTRQTPQHVCTHSPTLRRRDS